MRDLPDHGARPGAGAGRDRRAGLTLPLRLAALVLLCAATPLHADPAATLHTRFLALQPQLQQSPFRQPLLLESREGDGRLEGNIHALTRHAYADVAAVLARPARWCEILLLHPNVRGCRHLDRGGPRLAVRLGRSFDQPPEKAHPVEFRFGTTLARADYLGVQLLAARGPVGTSDYRIALEALSVGDGQTFLHLTYGYDYGWSARMATQLYLATSGSDKVGFTRVDEGGGTQYVRGVRGALERNAMRYYLAIDAYLQAASVPPAQRFERSVAIWLDAIARYPRQLQEESREAYLAAKRSVAAAAPDS